MFCNAASVILILYQIVSSDTISLLRAVHQPVFAHVKYIACTIPQQFMLYKPSS